MNQVIMMIISILLTILALYYVIPILRKKNIGQHIREEGNKAHYKKANTPTIGGLVFIFVFIFVFFISVKFTFSSVFVLANIILFSLVGFIDDYEKVAKGRSLGLNSKQKLVLQFGISFILILIYYLFGNISGYLDIPFTSLSLYLGFLVIPILMFISVGTVNSSNLTDGLDGLLSSVSIPIFLGIFIISMNRDYELAKMSLIFLGVLLGFLAFNSYPASVFMGDTGSMAIGGAVSSMMIVLNKPIYLVIIAGVYLIEALSVILQVFSYKKFGKRIFLMSPLHHHYELKGLKETTIVARFQLLSIILVLFTIYLLK